MNLNTLIDALTAWIAALAVLKWGWRSSVASQDRARSEPIEPEYSRNGTGRVDRSPHAEAGEAVGPSANGL